MRKITVGGMSRGGGGKACAKRVAPPAVPAEALPHRLSGSSFGSQGYASCEEPYQPPDTPSHTRDDHSDYGSTVSGASGTSGTSSGTGTGRSPGGGAFTFPHKHYHLDDQGIDMTQSPGRSSPSSSGSEPCSVDVRALLGAGVPDAAVLDAWLRSLQLPQYAPLLAGAGYDVPTAARMTPEDLTAVGVRKPQHRRRLKQELAALALPDHLPSHIPGSLEEWLHLLRLEEYGPALCAQGYRSVHDVTQLAWEDLEDLGIVRLGHQKKILLAIKRVRDILAGKHIPTPHASQDIYAARGPWPPPARGSLLHAPPARPPCLRDVCGADLVPIQLRPPRGKSLESLEDAERAESAAGWRRCYDDGDVTPTNDLGGGTLPRLRTQNRTRPVAKVQALRAGGAPGAGSTSGGWGRTRVMVHVDSPPLALPACPSSESLSLSMSLEAVLPPPPPAPSSPHRAPRRHTSDGSFQSSSSTESDSLPFANDNAGTIKPPRAREPPPHPPPRAPAPAADVLSDIGNMLATLTDELDAMLEEEKRQGLAHS